MKMALRHTIFIPQGADDKHFSAFVGAASYAAGEVAERKRHEMARLRRPKTETLDPRLKIACPRR